MMESNTIGNQQEEVDKNKEILPELTKKTVQKKVRNKPQFKNNRFYSIYKIIKEVAPSLSSCGTTITYSCQKGQETVFVTKYRREVTGRTGDLLSKELAEKFLDDFSRELKALQRSSFTTFTDYWIELEELDNSFNIFLNIYIEELVLGDSLRQCARISTSRFQKLTWLQQIIRLAVRHYSNVHITENETFKNDNEQTGPAVVIIDGECKLDHHHFLRVFILHTLNEPMWRKGEITENEERKRHLEMLSEEYRDLYRNNIENRPQVKRELNQERPRIWRFFLCRTLLELFGEDARLPFSRGNAVGEAKNCNFGKKQIKMGGEKLQLLSNEEYPLFLKINKSRSKTELKSIAAEMHKPDQEKRFQNVLDSKMSGRLAAGALSENRSQENKTSSSRGMRMMIRQYSSSNSSSSSKNTLEEVSREQPVFENNRFSLEYAIVEELTYAHFSNSSRSIYECIKNSRASSQNVFVTKYRQSINHNKENATPQELAEKFLKIFSHELKSLQKSSFTTFTNYWIELEELDGFSSILLNIYIEEMKFGKPLRECVTSTTSQAVKLTWLQQIIRMSVQQYSNVYLAGVKQRGINFVDNDTGTAGVVIDGQCKLDHHHFLEALILQTLKDCTWCEKKRTLEENREYFRKMLREDFRGMLSREDEREKIESMLECVRSLRKTHRKRNSIRRHGTWLTFLSETFLKMFTDSKHHFSYRKENINDQLEEIGKLLHLDAFCLFTRICTSQSKTDLRRIAAEIYTKNIGHETRYTRERKLGSGSYGVVYLARHVTSNRRYAVKILKLAGMKESVSELIVKVKETVRLAVSRKETEKKLVTYYAAFLTENHSNWIENSSFEDDARLTNSIVNSSFINDSSNYKTALETPIENETNYRYLFIVMEACQQSLLDKIEKKGVPRSGGTILELLEIINYLNDNGYMHRDVKPSNVLITKTGKLVLSDLDSIKRISNSAYKGQLPLLSLFGTRDYMSPEMEEENRNYNETTDYFSLGMSLIRVLGGSEDVKSMKEALYTETYGQDLPFHYFVIYLLRWLTVANPANRCHGKHLPVVQKLLSAYPKDDHSYVTAEQYWIVLQNRHQPSEYQRWIRVSAEYETLRAAIDHYIAEYTLNGDFSFTTMFLKEHYISEKQKFAIKFMNNQFNVVLTEEDRNYVYVCNKESTITVFKSKKIEAKKRSKRSQKTFGGMKTTPVFFTLSMFPKLDVCEFLESVIKVIASKNYHGALEIFQLKEYFIVQYTELLTTETADSRLNSPMTLLWSPEMIKSPRSCKAESDVFSSGLLLYYLSSTEQDDRKKIETMRKLQSGLQFTKEDGIDMGLQQQIAWMCHPNIRSRPSLGYFKFPLIRQSPPQHFSTVIQRLVTSSQLLIGTDVFPHFCTLPGLRILQEDLGLEENSWILKYVTEIENQYLLKIDENRNAIWVPIQMENQQYVKYLIQFEVYFDLIEAVWLSPGAENYLLITVQQYRMLIFLHIYVTKVLSTLKKSHQNGYTHGNIKYTRFSDVFFISDEIKYWIGFPSFQQFEETATKQDIYDTAMFLCNGLHHIFQTESWGKPILLPDLDGIPSKVANIYREVILKMTDSNPTFRPSAAELLEKMVKYI